MTNKYVTCHLMGGLGNQMFQIAAAVACALENGLNWIIPSGPDQRATRKIGYSHTVFHRIPKLNLPIKFAMIQEEKFCYTPLPPKISENVVLYGYFQSPKYFQKFDQDIKELFSPSPQIETLLKGWSFENSLAIHVRRGDYLRLKHIHPPQPIEYYKKALEITGLKFEKIYIFSDDIDWCKAQPLFQNLNPEYIEQPDYISLHMMSRCSAHIIANSTFSWWGAYLSKGEKVICPKNWFGSDGPATFKFDDLIPENWISI